MPKVKYFIEETTAPSQLKMQHKIHNSTVGLKLEDKLRENVD